jgi:hypothetical protein
LQKLSPALEITTGENLTLQTTLTDKARAPLYYPDVLGAPYQFNTPFRSLATDLVVE